MGAEKTEKEADITVNDLTTWIVQGLFYGLIIGAVVAAIIGAGLLAARVVWGALM